MKIGLVVKQFKIFLFIFLFAPLASADQGAVDILVSQAGLPLEDYEVLVDQKKQKTDSFGFVTMALPVGQHILHIKDGATVRDIAFQVEAKERTQLLVNIFAQGVISEVNEPEKKTSQTLTKNQNLGRVDLKILSVQGEPIANAKVYARGTQITGNTDRAGHLQLQLPVGEQVISVTHPKYSTQVVRQIEVSKDGLTMRQVELTPIGLVLEDFVVLAPSLKGSIQALIEVRRKAADVADVMSAEQMAKTGDSDAAASLRRVTGLTLKDGKYVYVRGLGERYSATLLNGVALPSPDPSRRVVPLDLFPVQFLDSMVIQKSYSPNMPGQFGGGVVQLQTKAMPEKFYFKANVYNSINTNTGNLLGTAGGSQDWLGVDDGHRKLPDGSLQDPSLIMQNNAHTLYPQNRLTNANFSFSAGNSWRFRSLKTGFTLAGLYKDKINYTIQERKRYSMPEGVLVNEDNYKRKKTQKERLAGGILGHQIQWRKHHKLTSNFIYLRNTTDYVAVMDGRNAEGNTLRQTSLEWAARTLKTYMVQGENQFTVLNDLKIDWHWAQSHARRDEPNRSLFRYSPNDQGVYTFNPSDNTAYQRRYYNLAEKADDVGVNFKMPFPWFYKRKASVEVGVNRTLKNRVSGMTRFSLDSTATPCDADLSKNLDVIFSQCKDSFQVVNTTRPTDNYNATQKIDAYYLKSAWPLLQSLNLSTGMRFENSVQKVDTISPFQKDAIYSQLNTKDWLPGSSLTWKFNSKMQMRFAQSETISRPDLRELSDTLWQDFSTGYDVQGNPSLQATVIKGYDARWEWYFGFKENLSVGFFYKDFHNPIERVFTAGSDPRISFFNVNGAKLYGAEFELSKNLSFVSSLLRHFTLSGNYAYILSDVQLGQIQNSESRQSHRPLQGQSNYTANFLLDYEHEPSRLNASLAFNVYGKRIAYTAPEGLPNIWEQPFNQLDFVMRKKLGKKIVLQAKIQNLLNPKVRLLQQGEVWQSYQRGQSYTLGIGLDI